MSRYQERNGLKVDPVRISKTEYREFEKGTGTPTRKQRSELARSPRSEPNPCVVSRKIGLSVSVRNARIRKWDTGVRPRTVSRNQSPGSWSDARHRATTRDRKEQEVIREESRNEYQQPSDEYRYCPKIFALESYVLRLITAS